MIRRRDPGHFGSCHPVFSYTAHFMSFVDALVGPIMLSIALFIGVLANFLIRGSLSFSRSVFSLKPRSNNFLAHEL